MADTKISAFTAGDPPQTNDRIPVARGAVNVYLTPGGMDNRWEKNTMSDVGAGVAVHTAKSGADFPMRTLDSGEFQSVANLLGLKDGGVSLAKLADIADATILANNAGVGGPPIALTVAQLLTLIGVEAGATADQTNAEIETAYKAQVSTVSQSEAEAGVATTIRTWTAQRVAQAIAALSSATTNQSLHPVTAVWDGGGSALDGTEGIIYVRCPVAGTIQSATTLADISGSAVIDVWKDTYANYPPVVADTITASALPTLSSSIKATDSTLTGWTTSVAAGDVFAFKINSASTLTWLSCQIEIAAS